MNEILIDKIKPNQNQPRKHFDNESLTELAESIKTHGLLNPILVRTMSRDIFEIVHGERRWRACKLAGLETIRAEIRELTEQEAFTLSLIENIQRGDLTPLEEADAYKLKLSEGITQGELGKLIGKSQSYIAQKLRLLKLPPGAAYCLRFGGITEGHARQLLRLKKMYPKSVPKRKKGTKKVAKDPIEFVNNHLETMQPELQPPIGLIVNRKQLNDSKFIMAHNAIVELVQSFKKSIPQWKIAACWWACITILGNISVADLGENLSGWRERYGSALVWWLCNGERWLEGYNEMKDKPEDELREWTQKSRTNGDGLGFYFDLIFSNSHKGVQAPEEDILTVIKRGDYILSSAHQTNHIIKTYMLDSGMKKTIKEKTGIDYWHIKHPLYGEIKRKEAAGEVITNEERIEALADFANSI